MPLEVPKLDTRTFDDLVKLARLRIPRYAPEWTDFNDSDPGMTLVQLFAWFTETMLFQLNRVPERNYLKLLQLLNLELEPAQPAKAHLTFLPQAGAAVQPVPRGTQVAAQPADGGDLLVFETEDGLDLIRLPLARVLVFDGSAFRDATVDNQGDDTVYRPFGWLPQVNNALYLGFQQSDPPALAPLFPQRLSLRVFRPRVQAVARAQLCAGGAAPARPGVSLVWEYRRKGSAERWTPLNVYDDGSACFTSEGYIRLEGPREIVATAEGTLHEQLYWLRCRIDAGSYAAGLLPEIEFIRPNVVKATNLATVRAEFIGESSGRSEQRFTLKNRPVAPNTLELWVGSGSSDDLPWEEPLSPGDPDGAERTPWTRQADLYGSTSDARHYTLNENSGEIGFGDGKRGRIPPAGAVIAARTYRFGGGAGGNVARGLIATPLVSLTGVAEVTNERPAVGGRNEQSIDELVKEAPTRLRCRERAVTADDFRALALQAGGVANATAIALAHPDHAGVAVPGAVTVVIVPDEDDVPPIPSTDQIRAVCAYLDQRRLLCTEVYVKGPRFLAIRVEATVCARSDASFSAVAEGVRAKLDAYLSPLRPRGAGGDPASGREGWAFGRDLFPTNLYGEILKVSGVDTIRSLAVFVNSQPHEPLSDPVSVPADGLVYGADHVITVIPVAK